MTQPLLTQLCASRNKQYANLRLRSQNCETFALIFPGAKLKLKVQMHDELFRESMPCYGNFNYFVFVSQINAYRHLSILGLRWDLND